MLGVLRTVQRGYHDGKPKPAGQVRRVHIVRQTPTRSHEAGKQAMCGQGAWNVTNSPAIIRDTPHALPECLEWCPKCIGHAAEALGRLEEVARLLGISRQDELDVLADSTPVVTRPLLDSLPQPHLAHVKVSLRRGEVSPVDDLLDALPADAPEHAADLSRPD